MGLMPISVRSKIRDITGNVDNNLFIKFEHGNMIIIEVYVDDIVSRSDDDRLSQKFVKEIQNEFQMYMLGEVTFFLGLHISQLDDGIFISQTKYIKEIIKKFKMEDYKPITTPMIISCKLSKEDGAK